MDLELSASGQSPRQRMWVFRTLGRQTVGAIAEEFDVLVNGDRLHAQRFGSPPAPLVIGIPGLTGNLKSFDYLGERIGGPDLHLVAVDLRGRVRSETTGPGTYGWESHARDVLSAAGTLGYERFSVVGQSMGGWVAMKIAQLAAGRLDAVVLVDVVGRVDPGVGAVVATLVDRVGNVYESADSYIDTVRSEGLIEPWTDYWERVYRAMR